LRTLAADAYAETAARRTALEALLAARDSQLPPILRTLLHDTQVRGQALRGLAFFDAPETPDAILQVYPNLPPAERRDALNTLASRAPYASRLLAAVVQGTIPRAEITAELARQLQSLKSNEVAQTLAQVWGVIREASPDMQQGVEKVRQVYRRGGSTPGDAPRGRVVFNRICAQCHHLFDFGGAVGPDITGANRGDLDYLIQNIVYPNAVIPNEYRVSLVTTRDDRTLTGIVKSQDANGLLIQTANELLTLTKAEVAKVELSEISMMPEGLLSNLTETEIRNLLYYLTRPGQVPLPAGTP
jgi:putative heme-binding domain-containing protein